MDLLVGADDLFAELDTFIDDDVIETETRRDPEDLRQAKQDFNRFKLKKVVQTLRILNNDKNNISVEQLAKRVKMTPSELKLHDAEFEFFEEYGEQGKSYAEAIDVLQTNTLREVKQKVLEKLRSLQRNNELRPHMVVNLNYIKHLGKQFAEGRWWLCKFDASNTWAKKIRLEFQSYKTYHLKSPRAKNFSILIDWVKEQMQESDELSYNAAKEKYEDICGQKCKRWSNTANLIRKRLSLDFKCVNERFTGSRGKSRVRKLYSFVSK